MLERFSIQFKGTLKFHDVMIIWQNNRQCKTFRPRFESIDTKLHVFTRDNKEDQVTQMSTDLRLAV